MRKVTKILGMIGSAALLLLILLPITLSIVVTLPSVQNRLVSRATRFASHYLGTEVSIGRIDVSMRGGLELYDFLVCDLQQDTMIYARRVESQFEAIPMLGRRVVLGNTTIQGGEVNLAMRINEEGEHEMNIRQISLMLTAKDRSKPQVVVDVDNVVMEGVTLRIKQLTPSNPPYGVDMRDIELRNMAASVSNLIVDGPSVHAHINRFSTEERSGFQINSLSGEIYITEGALAIVDMSMQSRWSRLEIDQLFLANHSWRNYRNFNQTTAINIEVSNGRLSSDDVAYFAPSMRDWGVELYNMEFAARGEVANLDLDITNISYGESTRIATSLSIEGLPDVEESSFLLMLDRLVTSPSDLDGLKNAFTRSGFDEATYSKIEALGRIELSGEVEGRLDQFRVDASLSSDAGGVVTNMSVARGEGLLLDGVVDVKHLKMGDIIPSSGLGDVTMQIDVDGSIDGAESQIALRSEVEEIAWRNYLLRDVDLAAEMAHRGVSDIEIICRDPHLKFDLRGSALNIFNQKRADRVEEGEESEESEEREEREELKMPQYSVSIDLNDVDLKAIGLNQRDSISRLRGLFEGSAEGRDLEEAWGRATFSRGEYIYNSDTLALSDLNLTLHSQDRDRRAIFMSDYFNVDFESHSRVSELISYIKGVAVRYMPSLYDDPQSVRRVIDEMVEEHKSYIAEAEAAAKAEREATQREVRYVDPFDEPYAEPYTENYTAPFVEQREALATHSLNSYDSELNVEIFNLRPIVNTFSEGLTIGDGSHLVMRFNPRIESFEASVESPIFEYGTTLATGISGRVDGVRDTLRFKNSIKELLIGTSFLEQSTFEATAYNDMVDMHAQFTNQIDSAYVNIGVDLLLARDSLGKHEIDMQLLPSTIDRRNEVWQMRANAIKVNSNGFDIDDFRMESRNQLMVVNGRATTSPTDTLRMRMQNFDLSIFSTLIARLGYNIEGLTNGEAVVSSVLNSRRIEALVELDSVSVNTLAAPAMLLSAEWDSQRNRARLHLQNRVSRDTLMRGYYIPSGVKYYALLEVDSLPLAVIDPPLGGVITNTEGVASISLTLMGERRNAHLNGEIKTQNLATTIDFTKVRYGVPEAVIEVQDNLLRLNPTPIVDERGGGGMASLEVDLQHLSNISYKLQVAPQNLMVLNTDRVDNDTFYGQIFASGRATIEGDKRGVKMDVQAQTEDNSQLFMPLGNKTNISQVDFITFEQPQFIDSTSIIQMRRLQLERRKQNRGAGSMQIDMSIDVRPNAEMQLVIDPTVGDIIRARGTGQINMRIEPQSNQFDMYGDYTIESGSYLFTLQNIMNKRFVIDPGSLIQWTGSPMDPILDINAIYQLKTSLQPLISDESSRAVPVNCVINLSDRLTHPEVSFAIDLPSADPEQQSIVSSLLNDQESISRQFFYLMLANSFISDSASGSSDLGVSTTTATGFELLTNQLSNWLSSNNYSIIIRYRPESELTGDEVDLGFSRDLINNRLLLELEGNYIIDNKQALTSDASDFMGEAYLTWLIDQAGALRLKGFTQTIDRFDENQGLQETGIGIYYREDFNNLYDLRQRVRARFKADEDKQEAREARRAARKSNSQADILYKEEEESDRMIEE